MKKAAVPSILVAVVLLALAVIARGAAGEENPADRISNWCLALRPIGPHRGFPPGSARAWVRGGEKHCH